MIWSFSGMYSFLSNFSPSEVEFEGVVYPTVEHAFQAAKSLDSEERKRIAATRLPSKAKETGQRVALRPDWEEVKVEVMGALLVKKFEDPKLREMLLATGETVLVEGNHWHDNFYGDCRCGSLARCRKPGENQLGKLLMELRDQVGKKRW